MLDNIAQSVGVDISKDTLDVHLHPAGTARRFANKPKGWRALIEWLAKVTVTRLAFEPTGAYHHGFERQLAEAGLPICKVNPRQARRFAEAIGSQAKTDAVDAAMLARLAALLEPPVRRSDTSRPRTGRPACPAPRAGRRRWRRPPRSPLPRIRPRRLHPAIGEALRQQDLDRLSRMNILTTTMPTAAAADNHKGAAAP